MSTETASVYRNFIGGEWRGSVSGNTVPSLNPASPSEIVGWVQQSAREDLDMAVSAAKRANKSWRALAAPDRGQYLYKAADILERRLEEIARTMTLEMGKTLPESRGETARGVAILRYYAGEGMRKVGDVIPSTDPDAFMYTTRVPLGVVGVITPWNFPVAIPVWKIAPALIYGNTIIFKPASETAVTAAKIVECFEEAGLPQGVVNMVTGSGSIVGQGIIDHPDIDGITFTGSNQVGKQVARGAVERGAKYQVEMGGKNPVIVAADADLEAAVEATISGGFRSTGQKCTATSRVIVLDDIYDAFVDALLKQVQQLKIGNGMDGETWLGPCASESQYMSVLQAIEHGLADGASLLWGGKRPSGLEDGYFVEPTIFEQVTPAMRIAREEIFGPVLALMRVRTLEEAIELANDAEFGLSASIFTKNIGHMLEFVHSMDAGMIRINAETAGVELQAPFGGMKQSSSHSREQGQAAIEFYTAVKTVFVKP